MVQFYRKGVPKPSDAYLFMYSFAVFIIFLYVVDILAMFYFGIHCYIMLYLYLKNPEKCSSSSPLGSA